MVERTTRETRIRLALALDGGRAADRRCPMGSSRHMLQALATHGGFGLEVEATGDTHVDLHHTVEDVGIALGEALALGAGRAAGDRALRARLRAARRGAGTGGGRSLGARQLLRYTAPPEIASAWVTADFPLTLVADFFQAVADRGRLTLHLDVLTARNGHHAAEAAFKAVALALRQAVALRAGVRRRCRAPRGRSRHEAAGPTAHRRRGGQPRQSGARPAPRRRARPRSPPTRSGSPPRAACCSPASAPSPLPARLCAARSRQALRAALDDGAWLLGICVGFQILFEAGEEFGATDGLGLLPGRVTRLPQGCRCRTSAGTACTTSPITRWWRASTDALRLLRPQLRPRRGAGRASASPAAPMAATFPAVAGRGRVIGTQFHPERSGEAGLRLLANFLALAAVWSCCPRSTCGTAGPSASARATTPGRPLRRPSSRSPSPIAHAGVRAGPRGRPRRRASASRRSAS